MYSLMVIVYPRGLSPRTRRNHHGAEDDDAAARSISAHAEEPSWGRYRRHVPTVYLRARGGTSCLQHIDTY
ncbi:Hypothetical protein GbCGDNIH3_7269 [Granulibacter bethesdensis]|uniref:Uncharacterized protein n=1 Tax=Granulibacter bethesdensis TaxID=364410 RepID=A0AAN0REM1_9PROT|nr:Hypothetical protein GbCGDNIH3_7269 [Granulibacter bethesdensis]